jgi:carbon-monoxide dehydrogenase large subunit
MASDAGQGVGARLERKEDDRFMRGRGQFVADIRVVGLMDVAFVRSPLAHARIKAIHVPDRHRDAVFTAADLTGVKPIRAISGLPGFKISEQPPARCAMSANSLPCAWRRPGRRPRTSPPP